MSLREDIEHNGLAVLGAPCNPFLIDELCRLLTSVQGAGLRNLRERHPIVDRILEEPGVNTAISEVLGPEFRCVRSILFDKRPDSNWLVPPHRDTTVCVRERIETPGFGPWSIKEGVPHVQPPDALLDGMLTLRLHLDPATAESGALRVWPGSHRLPDQQWDVAHSVLCEADRGDVLLMRPRLVHASSKSTSTASRRIVHLELTASELPNGLTWYESA